MLARRRLRISLPRHKLTSLLSAGITNHLRANSSQVTGGRTLRPWGGSLCEFLGARLTAFSPSGSQSRFPNGPRWGPTFPGSAGGFFWDI